MGFVLIPTDLIKKIRKVGYTLMLLDNQTLNIIAIGVLINPLFLLIKMVLVSSSFDLNRDFEDRIRRYKDLKSDFLVQKGMVELLIKVLLPYSMSLDMLIACYQLDRFMKENPESDGLDWMVSDIEHRLLAR